jgi:hypothetical protein
MSTENDELNENDQAVENPLMNSEMEKKKANSIWDEIAKRQAAIRQVAENARTLWKRLGTMPETDLIKIYLAFNQYDEYDPDCRYRMQILPLLSDWLIECEFNNIKMPVKLVKIIEDRLRPPQPENPNSFECGGVIVTPEPDNE